MRYWWFAAFVALAAGEFGVLGAAQAEKLFKSGVPAQEAANRYIVPAKFKNFPIYGWGFTIGPTITKLYAEWQAE